MTLNIFPHLISSLLKGVHGQSRSYSFRNSSHNKCNLKLKILSKWWKYPLIFLKNQMFLCWPDYIHFMQTWHFVKHTFCFIYFLWDLVPHVFANVATNGENTGVFTLPHEHNPNIGWPFFQQSVSMCREQRQKHLRLFITLFFITFHLFSLYSA